MTSTLLRKCLQTGLFFAFFGLLLGGILNYFLDVGLPLDPKTLAIGGAAAFTLGFGESFFKNYGMTQ